MNTHALKESTALAVAANAATQVPASGTEPRLLLLPLSGLRASSRNARSSGGTSISELAASIEHLGLLQNLSVISAPGGTHHEVVAGHRRLAALKLLVKRHKLPKDHPVPCLVVAADAARTVSLTENVQREAMTPIEELHAWKALVTEGQSLEDIAAAFGVTPLVVQRRLKLANVSPRILAEFAQGAVSMDQLMALAITDDHAAQEAAFFEAPEWQRSAHSLRARLTDQEVEAHRDALVKLVGLAAYTEAGGGVRRDLFAEGNAGVFLTDPTLLETLAREQMADTFEKAQAEGWSWVEVVPRLANAQLYQFHRARSTRREPNKSEAKRLAAIEDKQSKLQDRLEDENESLTHEQEQALHDESDALEDERQLIEQNLLEYPAQVKAQAGAVVSVDPSGSVVVHRGLLRQEQGKTQGTSLQSDNDGSGEADAEQNAEARPALSEKLVKRLSAHRTAALQIELARNPQVALVALVHRLVPKTIHKSYSRMGSPVEISASPRDMLALQAPDLEQAPSALGLEALRSAWADQLPTEPEKLFEVLLAMAWQDLMALLALCVAPCVDAMASREADRPAEPLARALGLDMHNWWTPTAAGYFEHVTKAKALEAVQVFAPGEVARLAKLKKAEIAAEAERLAVGSGWLPDMLSTPLAGTGAQVSMEDQVSCTTQQGSGDQGSKH